MKRKKLRIQAQARQEIDEAFDWYFKRSPEAADAFLTEIGAALKQIVSHPQLYPTYTKNTRRRLLEKYPYFVVFPAKKDMILIVAVTHAKRRPGYWRGRV
jgi:plasmid stabilization system protein ParE